MPAFFLFSGYYFFYKGQDYLDIKTYGKMIKQKTISLFLPYLIWATLPFLLKYAIIQWLPSVASLVPALEVPALPEFFYQAFWRNLYNYPLWYLRDLIVLTCIFPLIYLLAKRVPLVLVPIFALCLLGVNSLIYTGSIFYFLLGAVCGTRHIDLLACIKPYSILIYIIAVLGTLLLPFTVSWDYHKVMTILYVPFLLGAMLLSMSYVVKKYPTTAEKLQALSPSVFFIYAVHSVLILAVVKGLSSYLGISMTVYGYFLRGIVVLILSWIPYVILRRFFPRLLAVLVGGRV